MLCYCCCKTWFLPNCLRAFHQKRLCTCSPWRKESGKDPVLTKEGNQRAGDLMRTLKDKHIKRIYVTQFKRTQMTGDSLRIQLALILFIIMLTPSVQIYLIRLLRKKILINTF
ncbi:MAG: histidine phosphatase family protein [Ferruginibacter sp.]